jgi:hypothetical protein
VGLNWWKMHHGLLDDPAIIRAAPEVVGWWVKVLAVACRRGGTLGDLDAESELEKLAALLRLEAGGEWDTGKAREIVDVLRARKLIERIEGADRPRNWDKFQGEGSTPRTRKHRESKRAMLTGTERTDEALRDESMDREQTEHPGRSSRFGNTGNVPDVSGVPGTQIRREESRGEEKRETQRHPPCIVPVGELERPDLMAEFHAWIERYPRQTNTDAACREWISLVDVGEITATDVPEIMAGLARWLESASWEDQDGKFIPRPDRWLQQKLWRDHPPKGAAAKSRESYPEWHPPNKRREPEDEAA